jgi:tetratricopeptide (TPR) repeat protein
MTEVSEASGTSGGGVELARQLEAERDFLLRSLDDLETERAEGGIDDASYRRLHDDYTARAAAVVRALRDGIDTRRPPPRSRRPAVILLGVVVFAALAGVALASALGARLPGQTSSGNTAAPTTRRPSASTPARRDLEAAVARNPSDVQARLALALELERENDLVAALAQYDQITKRDPSNAVAEAQAGRVLYLTAGASPPNAAQLVNLSKARLDHAVLLDPSYPDAHFFRAIVLANEFQDYAGAENECQRYLVLAPNGQYAEQARQFLAQLANARSGPAPTTSP